MGTAGIALCPRRERYGICSAGSERSHIDRDLPLSRRRTAFWRGTSKDLPPAIQRDLCGRVRSRLWNAAASGLTARQIVESLNEEYAEQFKSMSVPRTTAMGALLWDARFALMTVALAGFGRAIAEVGAVIIVGGNIDHLTRVMTTAIALETLRDL